MKLDILDKEFVWCTGTVLTIVLYESETLLKICYDGEDVSTSELIPQTSIRISPLGFYTMRKGNCHIDIPKKEKKDEKIQLIKEKLNENLESAKILKTDTDHLYRGVRTIVINS